MTQLAQSGSIVQPADAATDSQGLPRNPIYPDPSTQMHAFLRGLPHIGRILEPAIPRIYATQNGLGRLPKETA